MSRRKRNLRQLLAEDERRRKMRNVGGEAEQVPLASRLEGAGQEAMAALAALAQKCEAASGGSRELDVAIHELVVRTPICPANNPARAYTSSLDAAMSLVPEGHWYEIKGPRRYVNIPTHSPNHWSAYLSSFDHMDDVMGWGATAALAVCAAALKALALTEGGVS